jgi:Kef-type K+ transport system membrane component KefB
MTRSPSAALGILSQTRAKGPIARFTLNFVMASDIVVVTIMATTIMLVKPLIDPNLRFSMHEFENLGHELLGSVALGTTLGLVLTLYLRFVGKQLILVYLALGFGMTEVLKYLGLEALLTFMVAGFVIQNLSKQGEKLLTSIHQAGSIIYVIFFATAGAELDVPLLRKLWPVALLFFAARAGITMLSARMGAKLAGDGPTLQRWGWAGLVSQAGIALGIGKVIANAFPSFGEGFSAIVIACVALNEMIGPVLFKLALDRNGETSTVERASLQSLADHLPGDEHAPADAPPSSEAGS